MRNGTWIKNMFSENLFFETPDSRADRYVFILRCKYHNIFKVWLVIFQHMYKRVNPKKAVGSIWPSCSFSKYVFSRERIKPCFFDFWYYHESHLFWKFNWSSSSWICFFNSGYIHRVFEFFDISLLQRN